MRIITTTTGTRVELDGDVLAVIEAISRDLARRRELDYTFEDVDHEFQQLVGQMTEDELRAYLKESLFMSFNRFENDRLMLIVKASLAQTGRPRRAGRARRTRRRASTSKPTERKTNRKWKRRK
ncbi:MAG TPA: hypothetical protein VIX35_10365 [Vicinamibacterales bacterium]